MSDGHYANGQPIGYSDRFVVEQEAREIAEGLRDAPALPCFPCPHGSACCQYGVALDSDEALAIARRYGYDKVVRLRGEDGAPDEWNTALSIHPHNGPGGVCVFLERNACTLHDQPEYPVVCAGFPWRSGRLPEPYQYDLTICPEFTTRPELVAIERAQCARD